MQKPFAFTSIAGSVVAGGTIAGVSVITEGEAKGHGVSIDAKTLLSVKACAETHPDGVMVKSDHGTGFGGIIGVLRSFRIEGNKLLADLHLLKEHADFARIIAIAQTMPTEIGLSIAFSGVVEEIDGEKFARCDALYSVDLVDRPAANPSGLFESAVDSPERGMAENADKDKSLFSKFKSIFVEQENTELATANSKVTELTTKVGELTTSLATKDEEIKTLRASLDTSKTELKTAQDEVAKLPEKVKTEGAKEARRVLASLGHDPLKTELSDTPAADKTQTTLTGLRKVEAAFTAQLKAQK